MRGYIGSKLKHWYQTRPVREQWLLVVGMLAIAVWIIWFGIVNPLNCLLYTSPSPRDRG